MGKQSGESEDSFIKADLTIVVTNKDKTPEQIEECFQSIKAQTVKPRSIVLVDDGSQDPHAHAMAVSIMLPKNIGVSKARSIGAHMTNTKLLLFVDADDKLAPDFIQQCGMVIGKCDIAYPNMLIFGEVERNRLSISPSRLSGKHLMNKKNQIPVTSMMYRYVYETLGGFKELPVFEDWDFWLRAMEKGYRFKRANTLLWYRQTAKSRNHISLDLRTTVYEQITAPYVVGEKGTLCLKQEGSKSKMD